MTQVKMKKLVIHKFRNLKHVSLDLGNFCSIGGKGKCAPGKNSRFSCLTVSSKMYKIVVLPVVAQAIKFLCNRSDMPENELQFVETNKREAVDSSL